MRDFLHRVYGGWWLLSRIGDGAGEPVITHVDAGPVGFSDGMLPGEFGFKVSGQGVVTVGVVIEGTVEVDDGGTTDRYQAGDVFLASFPQADFACRTGNARLRTLSLAAPEVARTAGAAGGSAGQLRFLSQRPASSDGRDQWKSTVRFVGDLLTGPAATADPLVIDAVARLLAAIMLAVFPHAVKIGAASADSLGAWPAALRRVRLARAHADLLAAKPGDGRTVTAIAARWGFPGASRFTSRYREVYGVPPSRTLRES